MSDRKLDVKHLDSKIKEHSLRKSELEDLGQDIAASSRNTVVTFIDLADSTAMKEDRQPEDWLGAIYEFIRKCAHLIQSAGGTVVKRIGDEVMATFETVQAAQIFLESAVGDVTLAKYQYKIALDYGAAYHFQFIEGGEADPYGTVVDRCARIAKMAKAGSALCSAEYYQQLKQDDGFGLLGTFPLKGIAASVGVYFRDLRVVDSAAYLDPLYSSFNGSAHNFDGFKVTGRRLQKGDLRTQPKGTVRPFLAHELINIPKSPYSARAFGAMYQKTAGQRQQAEFALSFVGYLMDWNGTFDDFDVFDQEEIWVRVRQGESRHMITLRMPILYREPFQRLKKGQAVSGRGILERMTLMGPLLNYVDFTLDD